MGLLLGNKKKAARSLMRERGRVVRASRGTRVHARLRASRVSYTMIVISFTLSLSLSLSLSHSLPSILRVENVRIG